MATAITTYPAHTPRQHEKPAPFAEFLRDLVRDIRTTGGQMQGKVHSDLFAKHLLALANCYLALIVLLLCAMIPFLYLVNNSW
jgi:hypothetical protein